MKVSICIPTYNRADSLANCLNSIILNGPDMGADVQVCVSDNGSDDDTQEVVRRAGESLNIKYRRNERNLGRVRNYLQVIEMADGEFAWFLGDDDLLLPDALERICRLIDAHRAADFFFVNSYHLTTEYVASFPRPFDTANLPKDMKPFSTWVESGEMPFMDLVNPRISFDFLGGFYLAVFRRRKWLEHAGVLDAQAIDDPREFSHYDNTFPHVKIFARAFADSLAYLYARPLSVCLTGEREWSPMYSLVHGVRLVESLSEFRKNGLPLLRYLRCKNFALNNFAADFASMLIHKEQSGFVYINPWKLIMRNCLFPNFYLSVFYYIARKLRSNRDNNHVLPANNMADPNKDVST